MDEKIVSELNQNLNKNNELIDKMMIAFNEHSECKKMLDKEIKEKFFNKFVSVIDRMFDNKVDESLDTEFKLEDLYEELEDFLEDAGIECFQPNIGDKFDRQIHEATKKVEVQEEELDKTIQNVLSYGYKVNDIVIKSSKVSVNKFIK